MKWLHRVDEYSAPFFRAYAAVFFCHSHRVGAWFFLVTWFSPHAAMAGMVGLFASWAWARLLSLSGESHLVNSLLCGLFIGAFHVLNLNLLAQVVVLALFVTLIAHWLAGVLWWAGRLPVLSFPFVLGCWLMGLVSQVENAVALTPAPFTGSAAVIFGSWADGFFTAMGWLLLVPYPWAGALLFVGLLFASRYLAILAVAGFMAGQAALLLLGRTESNLIGFNFMLTAMALGGLFSVPSRASFLMAIAGAAMTGWLVVIQGVALSPFHLPLLTLPFLLAVYLWLGGSGARSAMSLPQLTLDNPQAPELAYEQKRLARVRGSIAGSMAVLLPFYGEWRVSQAFDGEHTHRSPWQHALDFDVVENQNDAQVNHQGSGAKQSDYFCFGAPLSAPVSGQVVQCRDELADVLPGEADTANNWGNYILLRTVLGDHVLLSHLKQTSLRVRHGEWVVAGQPIAACGSSGRAPEPHLHLHVQQSQVLGSPTCPFHLINVLVQGENRSREFRLYHLPAQGEILSTAPRDEGLASTLHFITGQTLRYRLRHLETACVQTLRTELTLLGQSRWTAENGASIAYEESDMVLGFYDRTGKRDAMLDMWALALGLTPLSAAADRWQDSPALRLLPLNIVQRLLVALLHPLGAGCVSHYRRTWDETAYAWRQEGQHCFHLMFGIKWCANTVAFISPNQGVTRLSLQFGKQKWEAQLENL